MNWDLENQVLSRAFHRSVLDPAGSLSAGAASTLLEECSLLVTVPLLAPPLLAKDLDENMMEKWGVARYRRTNPAPLAHRAVVAETYPSPAAAAAAVPGSASAAAAAVGASPAAAAPVPAPVVGSKESLHRLCAVVIDSGYSFTHVMPVYKGRTINSACKRSGPERAGQRLAAAASWLAGLDSFLVAQSCAWQNRAAAHGLDHGRTLISFRLNLCVVCCALPPLPAPRQNQCGRQAADQLSQGDHVLPVSVGRGKLMHRTSPLATGIRCGVAGCWLRTPLIPLHTALTPLCAPTSLFHSFPSPRPRDFSAWNMMDETWIINDVKEKLCYVSTDFERELNAARRSRKVAEKIRREYVLPNGSTVLEGYVKVRKRAGHWGTGWSGGRRRYCALRVGACASLCSSLSRAHAHPRHSVHAIRSAH